MKKMILTTLLYSSISFSQGFSDKVISYFDGLINDYQKYSYSNALIKSKTDLSVYLKIKDLNFPLNKLNPRQKEIFINSLTFNEKGLTSYNYNSLLALDVQGIYKILSLFGAQRTLSLYKKPDEGVKMLPPFSEDHVGYECQSRATCATKSGHICMTGC